MGDKWVAVRDGARDHSLRTSDPAVRNVASRWEQFVQYLALGLCQELGREVAPVWPRKVEPAARVDVAARALVEQGTLRASIRVPDAAAAIDLEADLRTRRFSTSLEITAPREGRPKTRINWLLRQLREAPDSVRIEVHYPNVRETVSGVLKDVRDKPDRLLLSTDPRREPRAFRVLMSAELGAKRGRGPGSFVRESRQQSIEFYRSVVQLLRPWTPGAPKLPAAEPDTTAMTPPQPTESTPVAVLLTPSDPEG